MKASMVHPVPAFLKDPNSTKLIGAIQRRKQADSDIQLLANRIKMLKQEEDKAIKKIECTRSKAQMILRMREENDRKMQERVHFMRLENEELEKQKATHLEMEERTRSLAQRRIQSLNQKRRQDVKEVRREKRVIKEDVQLQKTMDLERKKEQRAAIRASEEEARRVRELERVKALEMARVQYQGRINKEEEEAARREQEVMRMERMEMQLIQRLKNTQMVQQAALDELENALRVE